MTSAKHKQAGAAAASEVARLAATFPEATVGTVVGWSENREPLVDFAGSPGGATLARMVVLPQRCARLLAGSGAIDVLLMFAGCDPEQPIIVGVLESAAVPGTADELVLTAKDSVSIQCGDAKLTLTANGTVACKGTDIKMQAKRHQRIVGGSVKIN